MFAYHCFHSLCLIIVIVASILSLEHIGADVRRAPDTHNLVQAEKKSSGRGEPLV